MSEPAVQQTAGTVQETGRTDAVLNEIRDSIRGLRFGSVNIIVQDGVIIQIDRTEKRRLRGSRNNAS
jgi:hypothetical protein